jgi:predicted dehydrogenase
VQSSFSYFNDDPANVRNMADIGGGGIYDIGCYPITTSRFLFESEPTRVLSLIERDPKFGTDRLATALLDFPRGQALFVCSTQLVPYQRTQIFGTRAVSKSKFPTTRRSTARAGSFSTTGATTWVPVFRR